MNPRNERSGSLSSEHPTAENEMKNTLPDVCLESSLHNPPPLIADLIREIGTQIAAFEVAHPVNQAYHVIAALIEIERGVKHIEAVMTDDALERRKKYYELVGLLQSVQDCNEGIYSQGLEKILATILVKHHIPAKDAKKAYEDFCASHQCIFPVLTREMVTDFLDKQYAEAKNELRDAIKMCYRRGTSEWQNFAKKGLLVLAEVETKKIQHYQNKNDLFDTKFYTSLLRKTAQVMREPQNDILQDEYLKLANHNQSGRASLSRKLAGAMLVLIGAAMVVASVVADVASLGVSSTVSWTGKAGGCVTGLMGLGIFASGVQNGIAKATDKFNLAARKMNNANCAEANERTTLLAHRR